MTKSAVFNSDGFPQAFYSSEVNTNIPTDAVAITDAQWLEFLENQGRRKWADGTIAPYDPPPPPPPPITAVTPRQARLALLAAGLLDTVDALFPTLPVADQITWEYATEIERTDPLIASLGATLGLTPDQIDALFTNAAGL